MGRGTRVHTIEAVAKEIGAKEIGENLELIEVISMNYDNIDDGEMIWIENGTEEGVKAFPSRHRMPAGTHR